MARILTICPSRGRPKLARRMLDSHIKTSTESQIIFIFDQDDPCLPEYKELFICHLYEIVKSKTITQIFNDIFAKFPDYDFYHMTNDDAWYLTNDWDLKFIQTLEHYRHGIVYGNDMIHGGNLPCFPCISGDIVRALGWIQLPTLTHLYGDMIWKKIGEKLNKLFYLRDVFIEHRHWIKNPELIDDIYKKTNSQEMYEKDNRAYGDWLREKAEEDISRIRGKLGL